MGSMAICAQQVVPVVQLRHVLPLSSPSGLGNLGNTCFLNSVLQCLAFVPPLADACQRKLLHGVAGPCPGMAKCCCCLTEAQLRNQLQAQATVHPRDIVYNLHLFSKSFERGRQEDSHEFLLAVLDAVERDTKRLLARSGCSKGQRTLIEDLFCGRLRSQVRCLECGHCSNTYESITTLSLDILRANSIHDSLAQFTAPEVLDGANKYKCDQCKRLVKARKAMTIHHEPNVLVVHLKRFDPLSMYGKVSRRVAFEQRLQLGEYMSHPEGQHGTYMLTGVVVHQGGSLGSGHYYAYVRDSRGQWSCANDSEVRNAGLQEVLASQAYLLFYSRTSIKPLEPTPPTETEPPQPTGSIDSMKSSQFIGPQLPPVRPQPATAGTVLRQGSGVSVLGPGSGSETYKSEGTWSSLGSSSGGAGATTLTGHETIRFSLPLKQPSTTFMAQPKTATTTHMSKPGGGARVTSLPPAKLPAKPAIKQQPRGEVGKEAARLQEAAQKQPDGVGLTQGSSRSTDGVDGAKKRGREEALAGPDLPREEGLRVSADESPAKRRAGLQGVVRSISDRVYNMFRACPEFISDIQGFVLQQMKSGRSMEALLSDSALKTGFTAKQYKAYEPTRQAVAAAIEDIKAVLQGCPQE